MELAWWARPGISQENEARLNAALATLVLTFIVGWTYAVYRSFAHGEPPPGITRVATNPLAEDAPPVAAYAADAAIATSAKLIGASHKVHDISSVLTLVPLSEKKNGRIGTYLIGSWPYERGGKPRGPQYAPPAGLYKVTPENLNTPVSEHFKLGDFTTKGQNTTWPKYVAMSSRLLDKLELVIQELNNTGTPVTHVGIISAFRTPSYNESGGDPRGRAGLSRHMYGDAMDIYIDNNRDGRMDDLNKDGKVDSNDGRVIVKAAGSVERKNPDLIGGVGLYAPTGAHSGFVHIDTRGYRARWGGAT